MNQNDRREIQKPAVTRRDFFKTAAVSAGAMAVAGLAVKVEAAEAAGPAAAPAAAAGAPAAAAPGGKTLPEVMKAAREKLYPKCRVCPECDGQACSGEVPGMGGIGTGKAFRNNLEALASYGLAMKTFHDVKKPDTSITLFGEKLSMPILSAITGGVTYNMGLKGKVTEEEYMEGVIGGCIAAGTLGFAADGIEDPVTTYATRLAVIKKFGGKGLAQVKPRAQVDIIERMHMVEASGAKAIFIDIDSAGRAARCKPPQIVEPKTPAQLRELVKATKLPFVIKGVMTPEEAQLAVDVGAAGIVVSNHGGRVLDHTPGTAKVLPAIAKAVKGRTLVFADGGVRYGSDVLKLLALGANAVLVGRPVLRGSVGGGAEGVKLVLEKMRSELVDAMVLTGTASVKKVSRSILA
ncbi:alpha-hydroxy-acid oxidizing protein [Anaeromyxobacter diazotrophicus]|uniref:Alpha-hydroxy-acid oxidizing enzyme n=1 Tax=Anaeromyxobacter diazotrophicus TaxID=2590199 RepID=A0A7I9VLZ1_9BACT|nr:alpha-hydroxy-acid oxidizing protein [Anaeromyxobacter diazotrophicus]GEJ57424.1 alpha-hydroxy-acid oxidizing enzyme [Anaeromyxobacter diazotrophicus]